eukprot:scaffold33599_cov112-Isochrysis_galbana.AAC.1
MRGHSSGLSQPRLNRIAHKSTGVVEVLENALGHGPLRRPLQSPCAGSCAGCREDPAPGTLGPCTLHPAEHPSRCDLALRVWLLEQTLHAAAQFWRDAGQPK